MAGKELVSRTLEIPVAMVPGLLPKERWRLADSGNWQPDSGNGFRIKDTDLVII
jgi:hypothetical protein